jgi:hypothetical protein
MQLSTIEGVDDEGVRERFFNKVQKNGDSGCWIWTGGVGSHGYGAFGITHDDVRLAHRVSYAIEQRSILEGAILRHEYDTPKCVNPAHLVPGDHQDNLLDAVERGGYRTGVDHRNANLSDKEAQEIRDRYATGDETYAEIADDYPVTAGTVGDIVAGDRRGYDV